MFARTRRNRHRCETVISKVSHVEWRSPVVTLTGSSRRTRPLDLTRLRIIGALSRSAVMAKAQRDFCGAQTRWNAVLLPLPVAAQQLGTMTVQREEGCGGSAESLARLYESALVRPDGLAWTENSSESPRTRGSGVETGVSPLSGNLGVNSEFPISFPAGGVSCEE